VDTSRFREGFGAGHPGRRGSILSERAARRSARRTGRRRRRRPCSLPPRRNVGIFNQRGGTIGWLINRDGLLVVDSQFADTAPNLLSGPQGTQPACD
jgi:hypothetical protein